MDSHVLFLVKSRTLLNHQVSIQTSIKMGAKHASLHQRSQINLPCSVSQVQFLALLYSLQVQLHFSGVYWATFWSFNHGWCSCSLQEPSSWSISASVLSGDLWYVRRMGDSKRNKVKKSIWQILCGCSSPQTRDWFYQSKNAWENHQLRLPNPFP